jgi:hypothetical protein
MLNNWRERYWLSAETLQINQQRFAFKQKQGRVQDQADGHFVLGAAYLWHNDLNSAQEHLETGLELARRAGEARLECQCLVYLSNLWRLRGYPAKTGEYAARALAAAKSIGTPNYEAAAQSNLAWVFWRRGDTKAARVEAQAALDLWITKYPTYPFQWGALWLLLCMSLDDRFDKGSALEQARLLLAPTQQRLSDPIPEHLETAIQAGEEGDLDAAAYLLRQALALAQDSGYL